MGREARLGDAQGQRAGEAVTWIERVFDRVMDFGPGSPDRVKLARLATAAMLLPVVMAIKLWRNATWTRPK